MAQSAACIFDEILGREGWSGRPATLGAVPWSYGDLLREAEGLAAELRRAAGERVSVALMMHPRAHFIAGLLGIGMSNNIIVPVNPGAADHEKCHLLSNAGCRFLLTDTATVDIPGLTLVRGTALTPELHLLEFGLEMNYSPTPDDRMIIHTSGSTNHPKGVILNDKALYSNARAVADDVGLSPGDRALFYTPTAFAYAINQVLSQLYGGGALLPWSHGLLFPGKILEAIAAHHVTYVPTNVTALRLWLKIKDAADIRLGSVRCVLSAGQNVSSALARDTMRMFPNARIVLGYGCSENSPRVSHYWMPTRIPDIETPWPICRGKALDGTEIKVVDDAGAPVLPGGSGEVAVRGASLMRGYLHLEDLTAERVRDGWYHTGDLVELNDDGEMYLLGRTDNIFSVGHEKIAPEEVERVIEKIPGVTAVAVGHMPDPILDKACCALVSTDGTEGLDGSLRAVCREHLSANKIPKRIFFVNEVPKTLYGKIDRRRVQECIGQHISEESK